MKKTFSAPMMACGHTANAIKRNGESICLLCAGNNKEAANTVVRKTRVKKRMAQCSCGFQAESSSDLTLLEEHPDHDVDFWYCGHAGWERSVKTFSHAKNIMHQKV